MYRFTRLRVLRLLTKAVLTIIGTSLVSGMTMQTAHALQCGDKITTDIKLVSDLGPCPGGGLVISGDEVTLDFNGHTIVGSGGGDGIHLSESHEVTIKGPGTISNFATGISIGQTAFGNVLVYDLTLTKNQVGIDLHQHTAPPLMIRVLHNTILGQNRTSVGIGLSSVSSSLHVYQNTISGHAVAVWMGEEVTKGMFDENLITLNQTGIAAHTRSCFTLRGNRITLNQGDGINTGMGFPYPQAEMAIMPETCATASEGNIIQDNTVTFNGRNGIVVTSGNHATQLIQDNIVLYNKTSGISAVTGSASGTIQVVGNYTLHNGTDLLWDGINTNTCWEQNIFSTSSPSALPGCE
jgi:hypothetical protein